MTWHFVSCLGWYCFRPMSMAALQLLALAFWLSPLAQYTTCMFGLKIFINSTRNSWALNCLTDANDPKSQFMFHSKSPPQKFFFKRLWWQQSLIANYTGRLIRLSINELSFPSFFVSLYILTQCYTGYTRLYSSSSSSIRLTLTFFL